MSKYKFLREKHLLFIDHDLPSYDKDAGSKATFQYLKIFLSMDYKVYFIGDNFSNSEKITYLNELNRIGIDVLYGEQYAKNWQLWLENNINLFDCVVLSRPHIAIKYVDMIRKYSNAKIIYFGHDLHFLREKREYDLKKDEISLLNSKNWQKTELELMKKSDVSYYFSDTEKKIIHEIDNEIKVDVVPLFIFDSFTKYHYNPIERNNIMFVGGFDHTPNVDGCLWFVNDIFPKIQKIIPNIKFYIIGSNPTKEIIELESESIRVTGYISDEELSEYYKKSKLVVAPLRYGAGVKGKIIDALYHGMPIVTTPVGSEGIIDVNKLMKITDDSLLFAKFVIDIYSNNDELFKLSMLSRKYCEKYFSTEYAKTKINKFLKE